MGSQEATVLIVEDQEGLAEAYAAVLASQYEVRTAHSGTEGLEVVDADVDVILLDRRMPGMSGDEVLAELVDRDVNARIAMLTAVEPTGEILEMPFDNYVTKPIDNAELIELVEHLLTWNDYDGQTREYFRLGAKKLALESAAKERTEEYSHIVERMDELEDDVAVSVEAFEKPSRIPGIEDSNG